jgi:cytochrome c-type biogenesis protein CcmH
VNRDAWTLSPTQATRVRQLFLQLNTGLMSPRDWFWFLAGVLVTVAIMVTLRAWLRERPAQPVRSVPAFAIPIAAALGLIGVALGIYFLLGSPSTIASAHANATDSASTATSGGSPPEMSQQTANAGSLDEVTRKLANRLATRGGSDGEWQLLAESYDYLGKPAEAKAARAHVASAAASGADASGSDASAGASFDGQTMAAVADALDNRPAPGPSGTAASQGAAQISGTVEIASKLASRAPSGATLFIYAKQPNAPGPPLAVVRLAAEHWPVSFTLSDANAMVPGRNLSNAQTVQIEARISRNGEALPQSGDLVGTVTSVNPRAGHPVKISIDREIG